MRLNTLRYKSATSLQGCFVALAKTILSNKKYFKLFNSLFNTPYLFTPSGSSAIYYFLKQNNICGDVLLPAYTCDRVVAAIKQANCQAIFVDVDLNTGITSSDTFIEHCTANTKVVIPTVLFGNQIDLTTLQSYCQTNNIFIIEDRALANPFDIEQEALLADATIFSFGIGKSIQLGVGGLLATKEQIETNTPPAQAINNFIFFIKLLCNTQSLSVLRFYLLLKLKNLLNLKKQNSGNVNIERPIEQKILSPFSSILIEKLLKNYQPAQMAHSKKIAAIYEEQLIENDQLKKITGKTQQQTTTPFFAIRAYNNQALIYHLYQQGIDAGNFFNYSAGSIYGESSFPNAEKIAGEIILLATHAGINPDNANKLCTAINLCLNTSNSNKQ